MFTRRDFLRKAALLGGVLFTPLSKLNLVTKFPGNENLVQIDNFHLKYNNTLLGKFQPKRKTSTWQKFSDPEFGLSLDYPGEWIVETTIQQKIPFISPNAILKRSTFSGLGGLIDIDIWDAHGYDLVSWLNWWYKWKGATREDFVPEEPNAKLFGLPAIEFIEPGIPNLLTLLFQRENRIYRFWYSMLNPEPGVQALSQMVNTLKINSQEESNPTLPFMEINVPDSILVTTCCSSSSSGNPFPCQCDTDPNKTGNCTWWVYYKFGWVPFRGNASTWWAQVPDYAYWSRKYTTPPVNHSSIAWWNSGTSVGGWTGHVAHIANYTSGSTFDCTEMMWCATFNCSRSKTYDTSSPGGYIYDTYP